MGRRLLTVILAAGLATALSRPGAARAADGGTGLAPGDIPIPLHEGEEPAPPPKKNQGNDLENLPPAGSTGVSAGGSGAPGTADGGSGAGGGPGAGSQGIQQLPQIPELEGKPGEAAQPPAAKTPAPKAPPAATAPATPPKPPPTPARGGRTGTLAIPRAGQPPKGGHLAAVPAPDGGPPAAAAGAAAGATPDGGTPAAAPTAAAATPSPATHLVLPQDTPADLTAHWEKREAALKNLDAATAAAELKTVFRVETELGIHSLPVMSAAMVREGRADLVRGDPKAAVAAATAAVRLAPDIPAPRWFEARARFAAGPTNLGGILAAAWAGTTLSFGALPVRRATVANLALVGLVGVLGAGLCFLVLCLVVAARRFAHDFNHLFPSGVAPLQTSVLAAALVLAPIFLRLGLVVVALAGAAAAWLYLRRAQRVVVLLTLGAVAAAPYVVQRVADTATFWGTPAADVWRLEHTGDWTAPAARLKARLDAGQAGWLEIAALARWQTRQGHLDAAEALYQQGLSAAPHQAILHCGLGVVRYAKGDLPGAKTELEKAVSLDPTLAAAYHDLAKIDFRQGSLGPGQEARRRALELDPALVAAHPDADSRLNVAIAEAPIDAAHLARLARRSGAARRAALDVRHRLAGIVPTRAGPYAALGGALALVILGFAFSRLDPSRTCVKCGRPVCRRCAREVGKGNLCGQCVNVFGKHGSVEPQARARKEVAIRRYAQGRRTGSRILGVLLPGAGHVLLGSTVFGAVLLTLFAVAASGVALRHGPVPGVAGLGPALAPWRLVAFGGLGIVVYLVGLVSILRKDT